MSNKLLGSHMRTFRIDILDKTLKEVQGSELGIKTLSAFEHGRSSNYEHIFKYINACDSEKQVDLLMETLIFLAKHFF